MALLDGISFIPVLIGLFGIGEMLYQIFENVKESKKEDIAVVGKRIVCFRLRRSIAGWRFRLLSVR